MNSLITNLTLTRWYFLIFCFRLRLSAEIVFCCYSARTLFNFVKTEVEFQFYRSATLLQTKKSWNIFTLPMLFKFHELNLRGAGRRKNMKKESHTVKLISRKTGAPPVQELQRHVESNDWTVDRLGHFCSWRCYNETSETFSIFPSARQNNRAKYEGGKQRQNTEARVHSGAPNKKLGQFCVETGSPLQSWLLSSWYSKNHFCSWTIFGTVFYNIWGLFFTSATATLILHTFYDTLLPSISMGYLWHQMNVTRLKTINFG